MARKNYKEDFDAFLTVRDGRGANIGFPSFDFIARFFTTSPAHAYEVSSIGGVLTNCHNDNGRVHVVFDNHGLLPGALQCEFTALLPNGTYPDGSQRLPTADRLGIDLTYGRSDLPAYINLDMQLPMLKGEAFRYEDFTPDQLDDIRRPALEAASKAEEAAKRAEEAAENAAGAAPDIPEISPEEIEAAADSVFNETKSPSDI